MPTKRHTLHHLYQGHIVVIVIVIVVVVVAAAAAAVVVVVVVVSSKSLTRNLWPTAYWYGLNCTLKKYRRGVGAT